MGLNAKVIMTLIGFTACGVAKATPAARWQSTIGDVPSRSTFSVLQSAAAGGYGVAVLKSMSLAAAAKAFQGKNTCAAKRRRRGQN